MNKDTLAKDMQPKGIQPKDVQACSAWANPSNKKI